MNLVKVYPYPVRDQIWTRDNLVLRDESTARLLWAAQEGWVWRQQMGWWPQGMFFCSCCTMLPICIHTNQDFLHLLKNNPHLAFPCQLWDTINKDFNKAAKGSAQNSCLRASIFSTPWCHTRYLLRERCSLPAFMPQQSLPYLSQKDEQPSAW